MGGLVGENNGFVTRSYAAATVTGGREAGGLVGQHNGSIVASYATGLVRTTSDITVSGNGANVGGLVGRMDGSASVTASYSSAAVDNPVNPRKHRRPRRLARRRLGQRFLLRQGRHRAARGRSQRRLPDHQRLRQGPPPSCSRPRSTPASTPPGTSTSTTPTPTATSPVGGDDPWDFGTASQYPALRTDGPDANDAATWQEFGYQVRDALRVTVTPSDDGTQAAVSWNALAAPPSQWSAGRFTYQLFIDGAPVGGPGTATSYTDTALPLAATLEQAERSYRVVALFDFGAAHGNIVRLGGYDGDRDGLIAIRNLAQLNAMRWDRDGNGNPDSNATDYAAAFPVGAGGSVCPSICTGYELLLVDLDFDENGDGMRNDTYNTGSGWAPIGNSPTFTFDGNGRTISNLFINRGSADDVGLFGTAGSSAVLRNVGLINADVTRR